MIGILNLEIGNLRSVYNAVYRAGVDPKIIENPEDLKECERLIMPGVGSFQRAMLNLERLSFGTPLDDFVRSGKPVLGLCVGMQIMAEIGAEGGEDRPGLGWFRGRVERFSESDGFPVPHVGWNGIRFLRSHPVLQGVRSQVDFYFVHSFRYTNTVAEEVLGETEYGEAFPSILARDNLIGFQFHPEKSQNNGLKLIENFCYWESQC